MRAFDRDEIGLEETLDATTKYAELWCTESGADRNAVRQVLQLSTAISNPCALTAVIKGATA